MKQFILLCGVAAVLMGCGGSSSSTSTLPSEPTDECIYADELCADAEEFQDQYYRMPEEEQRHMTVVLNHYITECEKARKTCRKSTR